jgi:hypothetical protein
LHKANIIEKYNPVSISLADSIIEKIGTKKAVSNETAF